MQNRCGLNHTERGSDGGQKSGSVKRWATLGNKELSDWPKRVKSEGWRWVCFAFCRRASAGHALPFAFYPRERNSHCLLGVGNASGIGQLRGMTRAGKGGAGEGVVTEES